jgi:hypothetical protein
MMEFMQQEQRQVMQTLSIACRGEVGGSFHTDALPQW